jgi:peptidylprolyl isomerase
MRKAQNGDSVRVHFSVCYDDKIQFATTLKETSVELTIGDKKLIDCFEQSIVGMVAGEKKKVSIEPKKALGERLPELEAVLSHEAIPERMK